MTLAEKIDRLYELREQKRELSKQLSDVEDEYKPLELEILQDMESVGLDQVRSGFATVSLAVSTVPTVKDWDAFAQYIVANEAVYLLERRPAVGACRELFNAGESIPGVEPYERKSLNMRTR